MLLSRMDDNDRFSIAIIEAIAFYKKNDLVVYIVKRYIIILKEEK